MFRRDLARARTFGFMKDVERLWAAGYALGSSLENSVVIGDDSRIINMEGLRYPERVRAPQDARRDGRPGAGRSALHRLLPLLSRRPQAECGGAAPAAFRPSAFEIVEATRRERGRSAELIAVNAPVYAPWML